jgi:hypothetical protein
MATLPKVGSLTDDELRDNLIRLGYRDCGPITGTTRSTYEKKLLQLCQAGGYVVGPPAAAIVGTPSKPNVSNAVSASANGTQTPTRPTNGSSSTRSASTPSKPLSQQPPPNAAHLESLDETGSEDDQPAPSLASARRNLDQRSRSNDQAFRAPAPLPVAAPHALSDHLEQPSESDTDREEYASPHAPLPPQASTVPKKLGPAEQAISPRAAPPLEPSLMSTPIAATSGAGAYSGVANVPASPFMSLPPQASSGAYGFGAGVGAMSGRFPRAIPRAKQSGQTAASAANVTPAPGIGRRMLRFFWRQVRKHTFLTLGVPLIAILVLGILSAPATPGLGVEWCPFGYSGKHCQEKRAEVMQLYQRVVPLLQDAELEFASGRAESLTLTKNDLLQKITGIDPELWEAFFQASKASNWFVWSVAPTNSPATTAKKTDEWSRVLSLQLKPEQRRSALLLYMRCAVAHLKYAYEIASEVLTSYWQLFLIVAVSIFLLYGLYKIKLAMKKKKEVRLAAQIKKAIGLLKTQAEASNRNPQIPSYLLKTDLRDKVLQGSKANKYFIHELDLAVINIIV